MNKKENTSLIQRNRERARNQLNFECDEYLKLHDQLIKMVMNIPLNTYVKLTIERNLNKFSDIIVKINEIKSRDFVYTLYASEVHTTITNSIINSIKIKQLTEKVSVGELCLNFHKIIDWKIWSQKDAALIAGWDYISDYFKNGIFKC